VRLDQVYTDLTVDDQVQIGRAHIVMPPPVAAPSSSAISGASIRMSRPPRAAVS
jgi:hypothetical protein